ncbi:hypothetical protein GCM10009839_07470 [Catenulispora yoronensis]|uniref:PucR C-terminal helix-turn-helix domain-containing protein n=1 Tax=Catenulispora yoronensis TaxID=450799 RepID=A0ABP5F658_9ACTN
MDASPGTVPETVVDATDRARDVLELQRLARGSGTQGLLGWLAGRIGAPVFLIHPSGRIAAQAGQDGQAAQAGQDAQAGHDGQPSGEDIRELAVQAVRTAVARKASSISVDHDASTGVAVTLGGLPETDDPLLAAVVSRWAPPAKARLLADAAPVLGLSWQAERLETQRQRQRRADAHIREAVLRLLMNGHIADARQVAAALLPTLAETVQIHVVEGPPAQRRQLADNLAVSLTDAWVVPCPVYRDHVFVLAPVDTEARAAASSPWTLPALIANACVAGSSAAVPLQDTAVGYAQAFHALAAARHRDLRHCTFAASADPALVIGAAGARWAQEFLAPLRSYRRRRPQDPDGSELLATASSWLSFSGGASAHLKVHRNTVTARMALVQELLSLDLDRIGDQSTLSLAVRLSSSGIPAAPGPAEGDPVDVDGLLALPDVVDWAERQLRPLQDPGISDAVRETLATWLAADARIEAAAETLGVSTAGVRKRLIRIEILLERSLLRPPSAVHDLWLAHRAIALARSC